MERHLSVLYISIVLTVYSKGHLIMNVKDLSKVPEEGKLNFTQLARRYGREAEEFDVITEDGYILKLFHIIPNNNLMNSVPVLLIHGILDCADTFIIRGNMSAAITLANAGHDVWAANTRGNKYSQRHVKLDPMRDKKKFWNFSFHEIAYYDLPSIIDFVLKSSDQKKLNAIGHSQGTTIFFVLGSLKTEYNEKINLLIAMAPVVFLNHVKPPLSMAIDSASIINELLVNLNQEDVITELIQLLIEVICSQNRTGYEICARGVIFEFAGNDPAGLESDFFSVVLGHYPQDTSRKSLVHFAQVSKRKKFAQFDYGPAENIKRYKDISPPDYDLSKCTMRVALFASRNDGLSTLKDVIHLKKKLRNVIEFVLMEPAKWNHIDYIWGNSVRKYLYPHLFRILSQHMYN